MVCGRSLTSQSDPSGFSSRKLLEFLQPYPPPPPPRPRSRPHTSNLQVAVGHREQAQLFRESAWLPPCFKNGKEKGHAREPAACPLSFFLGRLVPCFGLFLLGGFWARGDGMTGAAVRW